MEYKKIIVSENDEYLNTLLKLSKNWADEKICPSYRANTPDALIGCEVYVVEHHNEIIAYALGNIKTLKEKTSYNAIGERVFKLDEIFVSVEYRNKGIGKKLYRFIEADVCTRVDLISVIATSYAYKELLKFYIDELDMEFNHALLVKRM